MGAPESKCPSPPITFVSIRNYKHLAAIGTPCQFRGQPRFRWNVQVREAVEVEVQVRPCEPCLCGRLRAYTAFWTFAVWPSLPIHPKDVCSGEDEQKTLHPRKTW